MTRRTPTCFSQTGVRTWPPSRHRPPASHTLLVVLPIVLPAAAEPPAHLLVPHAGRQAVLRHVGVEAGEAGVETVERSLEISK